MNSAVWRALVGVALVASGVSCSGGPSTLTNGHPTEQGTDPERRGAQGGVAQFIVQCELSHMAHDDPIVHPHMSGLSHLHQFFGNNDITADPSYDKVIGADTSCRQSLDTASYWAPALLDADGKQVMPLGMTAYYRPGRGVDPAEVVAYPAGIMLVAGDQFAEEPQSTDVVAWSCGTGATRSPRPPACPASTPLRMIVTFPDCWDGESIDGLGDDSPARYSVDGCPDDFPVPVPQLTIAIDYPSIDPEGLFLASGDILTGHADFWNVWDQAKLEQEVELCLNRDLVCGVSDLGSSR
ncbi:MAG: DUF1996 domain-containing protein [Ilumatobacteraceae bacterium]